MIATLAILIIDALFLGGSPQAHSRFEKPAPGLERLSGKPQAKADTPVEEASYAVDSAARGTVVFLLPRGPRTLRSFELVPSAATKEAWKTVRIRLLWDTDEPGKAGLELPVDLLFGDVAEGETAWVNRLPMPYRTSAMLVIDTEEPISGRLKFRSTKGVEPDAGYLRARRLDAEAFEESGRGRLIAIVADEPRLWKLSLDGGNLEAIQGLAGSTREGKTATPGKVEWFAQPRAYERSFRLETSKAAGALFWYSDKLSSGNSGRGK